MPGSTQHHDRGPMLIIVEDRNIHVPADSLLDLEAPGGEMSFK